MTDNLPPLPDPIVKIGEGSSTWNKYNAAQMQAYARAAIEKDRERQSVPAGSLALDAAIGYIERHTPHLVYSEIKAALAAAPHPQPVAWLVTGPFEKRSFDMQSFAESWCKGLNKGFGEDVYKISNLVVQSSEPHEKCNDERMCAACYSGQGKCKTQPVQQEPCPECDGTGTVAGSQAHFPCPLCTSPQAAQPLSDVGKDAARYRWLRSTTNYVTSNGNKIDVRNQPELWDSTIDAAIEAAHSITKGTT